MSKFYRRRKKERQCYREHNLSEDQKEKLTEYKRNY